MKNVICRTPRRTWTSNVNRSIAIRKSKSAQQALQEAGETARSGTAENWIEPSARSSEPNNGVNKRKKAAEQLEKKELKPLTAPNPSGRTGQPARPRGHRHRRANGGSSTTSLPSAPTGPTELTPNQNALENAREQQESVGEDVDQAGEDVARAARHEARLEKADLAEHLAEKAQDIQAVAAGEVSWSEQALDEAAEEADPETGTPTRQPPGQWKLTLRSTTRSRQSPNRQKSLEATLTPPEPSSQIAEADQPSDNSPSSTLAEPFRFGILTRRSSPG